MNRLDFGFSYIVDVFFVFAVRSSKYGGMMGLVESMLFIFSFSTFLQALPMIFLTIFFTSSKLAYNCFFLNKCFNLVWTDPDIVCSFAFNDPHWSILIILLRCLWVESTQWLLNYNFNRTVSSLSPFMDSSISVSEISQLLEHTFNAVASFTDLFWAFTIIFQKYFFTLWMPIWYCTGLCFFVIHFLMQIRCRDSTARSNTAR